MAEKKSRALQLDDLADRLDRLETAFSTYRKRSAAERDGEQTARYCSLPQVPERVLPPEISPHRQRLLILIGKKWVNGTKLRYYFFESGEYAAGNDQKDLVREGFEVWDDVGIGITFEEVQDISEAEIRIGFLQGDGAWSYVGRDVIDIPGQFEPTMNFGWDLTRDSRGVDVPVHEIGHTLGFPHEHQNPFAGIVWDEEAVYETFSAPPNRWDRQTTHYNILRKLPRGEVEGSEWDPNSIMHYDFPAGLILEPRQFRNGLSPEPGLSEMDKEQVRLFYPPLVPSRDPELVPFESQQLSLAPAEQKNFMITPRETRAYMIQTFGRSDTVMVLFEDRNGDLKYVDGDDDSGSSLNARLQVRLYQGRKYVLRIRMYFSYATGQTAVMLW